MPTLEIQSTALLRYGSSWFAISIPIWPNTSLVAAKLSL